jgi:excisionase family DNA binding protein
MSPAVSRPIPPVKLLTVPESALALGVSRRTTWRLIATGALRAVRVGVRSTRVRTTDLERYLADLSPAR